MEWITVIWSMGAAASLTLSLIYFLVWVRSRSSAHVLFAITAASFATYAFFELRVILARSPEELDAALRWAQVPESVALVSLVCFVWKYLDAGRRSLAWAIGGLRVVYVLPGLVLGGKLSLLDIPSLPHTQLLGQTLTMTRGIPNPWGLIGLLTLLLVLVFVGDASVTAWRRGDRRKALMVGITVGFILSAGLLMTALLSWAGLRVPVAHTLYYQALVALMGYELSRDVLRASQLARDLRASEARSQAILRAVPDLMFLQSLDGVYLDYHAPRPEHLFVAPESFLGRNVRDVLPPAVTSVLDPAFARAIRGTDTVVVEYEILVAQEPRSYEARMVRNDNDQILTMVRDVTERRRAEDALRESQQRYSLATAAGAVGVWEWNLDTDQIYVDPKLKSILGFQDAEIANRIADWGKRVHPDDAPLVMAEARRCIDGEIDVYEIAHRMVHKDGSTRWFLARGSFIKGTNGCRGRLVGTDTDITERKRAEDVIAENQAVLEASHREVQDLAGRLIVAQEIERTRIARDLHDDFSQQIAGLSIALSSLKRRIGAVHPPADLLNEVAALEQRVFRVAESIRNLSHNLHPNGLQHVGLVVALRAYCAELEREQGLPVTFTTEGNFDSTPPAVTLCLYRVAQEGLRNIVTHARARRAQVYLGCLDGGAELTIQDDGQGFDIDSAGARRRGLGLVSINERVRLVGGNASIMTELNKGTRLRVTVPGDQPPAAAS